MSFFLAKNSHQIFRCPTCDLRQTEFREDYDKFTQRFYGKGYFNGQTEYGAYANYKHDKVYIKKNLAKFIKRIKSHKASGRLLDVGCAMGYLVELALDEGFDAYGFDPSKYALSAASTKLIGRIKKRALATTNYPVRSFDVITLSDVLEHLQDPLVDLVKLKTFLKEDGIVLIATGDTGSLAAKVLGRRWTFYNPPQHLFFFNRQNLTTLLARAGFVPFNWFTIGKWLSLRYMLHLARSVGENNLAKIFYPLINKNLGRLPVYLPLYDNLGVLARRKAH